jgi:predicted nucleotidyltransferase
VEADMNFICEEINRKIPDVLSIILTGSFSRGEGPVKRRDGKFYPYNDYDIQVISKHQLKKERVDTIATEISKKLGYGGIKNLFYPFKKENQKLNQNFYIDLKYHTPTELKTLLPRIRTYELRNDSKILYGKDLRNLIPNYNLKRIPLSESAKLLLDRMSQLIEYYSTDKNYDKEVLTYFIQQAYAACCTALLQLSGKYQIGYKNSMEILNQTYKKDFPKLYKQIPNLHKKIGQFITWKTNPKKLPNSNVEEEWFLAKENILAVSLYFFSEFLNKKIVNLEELSKSILKMRNKFYGPYIRSMIKNKIKIDIGNLSVLLLPVVSLILKYKYYHRLKKLGIKKVRVLFNKSPDLIIFASLPFIIDSIKKNGIDKGTLMRGKKILEIVYPAKGREWEELSIDYANAYIAFFMQKI